MSHQDLVADLRSRINPTYAAQLGTESYERRLCAEAIEDLIAQIAVEKERADYAWRNTRAIEKARKEEMSKRDELLAALKEVVRVFEEGSPGICDTVWISAGGPETLYDHCRAAIAKVKP
jgi:hypothetical protein